MATSNPLRSKWMESLKQFLGEETGSLTLELLAETESCIAWAERAAIPKEACARASAATLGIDFLESIADLRPADSYVRNFPIGFAREHGVLVCLDSGEDTLFCMSSIDAWKHLDTVGRVLNRDLTPVFAPLDEILKGINRAYELQSTVRDMSEDTILIEGSKDLLSELTDREDLLKTSGQAPVIELVNQILLDAVKNGASDVHFQPYRDKLTVRYRIDGVLFDAHKLPKAIQEEATSRVKVMGKMNIAEKRLPQDGRATVAVGDRLIDLRIASLPGSYGERVVLRLLDKSARLYTLTEVGMDEETQRHVRHLISLEHGLILLTGPTGSGKTTTLYAALQEINTSDRNVVTLEDPIEYDIEGISQTQINTKKGLTFASGLRNVLRQDPDIIMVGEIRDPETASMAIQSALTGHLVFSTLHTNDASSAVARLLDLGIEPYLVSSSLLAVLAQRLVRKVCTDCSTEHPFTAAEKLALRLEPKEADSLRYRAGTGCPQCRGTGYRGRVAISELLLVDEPIREIMQRRATASEIRDTAVNSGMQLLREDGIEKILSGVTTPSEVERVTIRTIT